MRIRFKKVIFWIVSVGFLVSVFTFGQIFYYNQKVASVIKHAPNVNGGKLTANLTAALQGHGLILKYQEKEIRINSTEFKTWVESYTRDYSGKEELRINADKITAYLESISKKINISPKNARLIIDEGKASEFEAPQPGLILNVTATTARINAVLAQSNHENEEPGKEMIVEIVTDEKQPEITLDKINNLGINTLLARGESNFTGSPKSRAHNIAVGSNKFTGIILKPGEEFSFNKFLGDVDASTGYQPELVIKKGALIPEYGGGLCQVSTTLFRAVALAGLSILERHPHSLPVRYYNPQGFDATIYPGVSDFRFQNDTPAHILIQSKIVGTKIYFEIYGTNDARKTTLDGPRQYDIKSNGSMKAELIRIVTHTDGHEKKDIFQSSYKAPGSFPTIRNPLE